MNILHLPLKKQWYDMIERGEKLEEYRDINAYWLPRLVDLSKRVKFIPGEDLKKRLHGNEQ